MSSSYVNKNFKNTVLKAKDQTDLKNWKRTNNYNNELNFEIKKDLTKWRIRFIFIERNVIINLQKIELKKSMVNLYEIKDISSVFFKLNSDSKSMIAAIKFILTTIDD